MVICRSTDYRVELCTKNLFAPYFPHTELRLFLNFVPWIRQSGQKSAVSCGIPWEETLGVRGLLTDLVLWGLGPSQDLICASHTCCSDLAIAITHGAGLSWPRFRLLGSHPFIPELAAAPTDLACDGQGWAQPSPTCSRHPHLFPSCLCSTGAL